MAFQVRDPVTLLFGILLSSAPSPSWAQDAVIGFIKSVDGHVALTHGQLTYAVEPGAAVREGDTLHTFWDGTVGVTFKDDTRISLGPSSRVTILKFEFAPAEEQYSFVLRLLGGTMQYLSGLIAKLSPSAMKVETPTATVGVRGTRFLARADP
jgi:hypothetical protein